MNLVLGYLAVVVTSLIYLTVTEPAVMAIAAAGGVVICVAFYYFGCWLGFFRERPRAGKDGHG